MKNEKRLAILTGLLTLFPLAAGLILWNRLPDRLPTHWSFYGAVDGYGSKALVVCLLPLFLLGTHVFCVVLTLRDPGNRNVPRAVNRMILWICPVLGILLSALIYPAAAGRPVEADRTAGCLVGGMLLVFGNYLPKCRQNQTIGIRLPWTLRDADNWTKTHRLAGPLWMLGGCTILFDALFLGLHVWALCLTLAVLAAVPFLYSFSLSRRNENGG